MKHTGVPAEGEGGSHLSDLDMLLRGLCDVRRVDDLMALSTRMLRRMLAADGATFVLRDAGQCYYAAEDAVGPLWRGARFPMSACISGWCMIHRTAVAIPDVYLDNRIPADAYRPTFVHSLAMAPVRQDDPIAAMGAYWSRRREVSSDELALLQTVANATAAPLLMIALERDLRKADIAKAEASHRLQNLLSTIQAIARHMQETSPDVPTFVRALSGRLAAIGRAQQILLGSPEGVVDLHRLIHEQVPEDVDCSGQPVGLPALKAFDMGLVLHELRTNALKHGALSAPGGKVAITWSVEDGGDERMLDIEWRERGGPRVESRAEAGFGSTLIDGAFRAHGGFAKVDYSSGGVICRIHVPLG